MMASYQDAGGDKIAAPQGQRSRGGHDTINRGQGMTQVIRFKDRKQTLSNEHGHYQFVSGEYDSGNDNRFTGEHNEGFLPGRRRR